MITLTGNIGGDPSLRVTASGKSVLDLRLATTPRKKIGEETWEDLETLWFDVTCWDKLAENAAESLKKGDRVTVVGKLAQSSYTKEDGSTSTKHVIGATALGVDLSRNAVLIKRVTRESAGEKVFGQVDPRTGELTAEPVAGSVPVEQLGTGEPDEHGEAHEVAA